jgi:hypothetical protein
MKLDAVNIAGLAAARRIGTAGAPWSLRLFRFSSRSLSEAE